MVIAKAYQNKTRQGGATVLEMALVIPAFLLFMIGVIEMSMAYFANVTMQHAVREGARYAVTGNDELAPDGAGGQRYLAVTQKIRDSSMGMYDKVSPVLSVNGSSQSSPGMFGQGGEIVVISIACSWSFATPMVRALFRDGKAHFVVAATMRNESFGGL